ncbi:MAG: isoprenylcysteine carboxylmethyltransferase family protein [Terriglobia bacterium]
MPSKISLKSKFMLYLSLGPLSLAALLFIPAGSLGFWQGWTFLAVLIIPFIASLLYFYKYDPQLIARRLEHKETIGEQKLLLKLLKPVFIAAFALPGLDYRLGWSRTSPGAVPLWLTLLTQALVLGGLLSVVWVMKVNGFAARTIRVESGQKVISTGPYGLVRHPMYLGGIVMCLSTPLALGSYFALPVFALVVPIYAFRLRNEEEVLCQQLPGYSEYCLRTRFRLVPFIW